MSLGGRTSRAAREHASAIGQATDRTHPECGICGTTRASVGLPQLAWCQQTTKRKHGQHGKK